MKIVNQSKGPIFWSTSFPGYGDCGTLAENATKEISYPKMEGSVGIRLKKGDNAVYKEGDESYQRFPVSSGDLVTVQILVNGVVGEAK